MHMIVRVIGLRLFHEHDSANEHDSAINWSETLSLP